MPRYALFRKRKGWRRAERISATSYPLRQAKVFWRESLEADATLSIKPVKAGTDRVQPYLWPEKAAA